MKCSNCGFENTEDAKFCGSCGNELENFLKDNEAQEQDCIKNTEVDAVNGEQQQKMDNKFDDAEETIKARKRIVIILAILVLVSSIVGYSYLNNPSRQFCSILEKGDYAAAEELVNSKPMETTEEIEATFVDAILKYEVSTLEEIQLIDETQWAEISTLQKIAKSLELTDNSEKYIEKLAGLQTYREDLAYYQIINNNREFFDNFMVEADNTSKIIEKFEELIFFMSDSSDPEVVSHRRDAENAINELQDLFDVSYYLFAIEKSEAIEAIMTVRTTMVIAETELDNIIEDINILTELKVDLK